VSVAFKDYYAILGVARDASQDEIKKAYRRKARELHPDVNKSKDAGERFRDVNEAYEVLGDPDKRRRYDRFGSAYREAPPGAGPPPGFEEFDFGGGAGGFEEFLRQAQERGAGGRRGAGQPGAGSGFSDFFEALFGAGFGGAAQGAPAGGGRGRGRGRPRGRRGHDVEGEIRLELADLVAGGQRKFTMEVPGEDGQPEVRDLTINLPRGIRPGQTIRLAGQGGPGTGGAPNGDLFLRVHLRPGGELQVEGDDLVATIDVPAPVAVTGGTARVQTAEGPVTLRIAPGTQNGTVLRVKERGLVRRDGSRGDLRARVRVVVPEHPTPEQKRLYEELARLG
jgi:curved DNA-binding protein